MDYSIVYIAVALSIVIRIFRLYRISKAEIKFRLGYIIELALVLAVFTLPFARGFPNPELSPPETAILILIFSCAVFGPLLADLAARVLAMRGKFGAAVSVKTFALLLDWSREARLGRNLLLLQLEILRFNIDSAIKIIERDLEAGVPGRLEGVYLQNLMLAHSYKREWAKVSATFEKLVSVREKMVMVTSVAGAIRAYAELGDWKRAEELLDWLGKRASENRAASVEYALSRLRFHALRGEIASAEFAAAELRRTKIFPPFFEPYWMGRAYFHAGKCADALPMFKKALEATPERDKLQREIVNEFIAKCESGADGRIMETSIAEPRKKIEEIFREQPHAEDVAFAAMLLGRTPVVWLLVAINIALYILTVYNGGATNVYSLEAHGSKVNEAIMAGEWWRLISCAFLHFGFVHLVFNVFALLFMGKVAEAIYGEEGFIITYVLSAAGASFASYVLTPSDSVGASGAIFGIVGLLIAFGIRHSEKVPLRFKTAFGLGLAPYVGAILFIGFIIMPGMDNWAHFAGLASGFSLGFILKPVKIRTGTRIRAGSYATAAIAAVCAAVMIVGIFHVIEPAVEGKKLTTMHPANDPELGITFERPRLWTPVIDRKRTWSDEYMVAVYGAPDNAADFEPGKILASEGAPLDALIAERRGENESFWEYKLKRISGREGERSALVYLIKKSSAQEKNSPAGGVVFMFVVKQEELEAVRFVIDEVVRSVKFY